MASEFRPCRQFPDQEIPLLVTGHLFVSGISSPGSIREIHVGTLGQLGCDIFPNEIDYVALGHIHRPCQVGGKNTIRYSGSPIPMNFDEATQEKSVVLVEFEGRTPQIKTISVPRFSTILRIAGDLKTIQEKLEELETSRESDERDCFVEVVYTGADPVHDLVRQVEDAVKSQKIDIVRITNEREKSGLRLNLAPEESLENLTEIAVFDRLLEDDEKVRPSRDDDFRIQLQQAYREILAQCQENS